VTCTIFCSNASGQ